VDFSEILRRSNSSDFGGDLIWYPDCRFLNPYVDGCFGKFFCMKLLMLVLLKQVAEAGRSVLYLRR